MKNVNIYRNFIVEDPFLDFMNKKGHILGYKKDPEHKTFDGEFLLSNYIKTVKKKFIRNIKKHLNYNFKEYDTNVGKMFLLKTEKLKDFFTNGDDYYGDGYTLFTVEYSTIGISKSGEILDYPLEQKFYKFKNWYFKRYCENQGFSIDYCFILGRKYKGISVNPRFDTLYEVKKDYSDLLKKAEEHLEKIENNSYIIGKNMFPNMKNKEDFPWHNAKKKIAERIKEITLVKNCSVKYRNKMVEKGFYKYTDLDIDVIKNKVFFKANCEIIKNKNMLFIDFEVLTNIYDNFSSFPVSNTKSYIFNIGCGYVKRNNFCFMSYMAENLNEEKDIIESFVNFINNLEGDSCVLCHWSHIEKTLMDKKVQEYNLNINKQVIWFDFHDFFKKNNILVKDCYTYKLKHIARKLKKHGLIQSNWDNTFSDGIGAMTGYIKFLKTRDKKIINNIAHYNMIDCKVLYEIYSLMT